MQSSSSDPQRIVYVIVVHGMGEQRLNSTLIDVVSRFSEVCRGASEHEKRNVVTLGQATGQTGYYTDPPYPTPIWTEFEGITLSGSSNSPFYGQMARNYPDVDNIRFLEVFWQDILQKHCQEVGQGPEQWIEAVIGRMERRFEYQLKHGQTIAEQQKSEKLLATLYSLEDTLGLLNKVTKLRAKEINDLAFGKYLGDVQVYNESLDCRREAIERLHALMDHLHADHYKNVPGVDPEYIVLAHSLGTVMSFDALVAAHAWNDLPMRLRLKPRWENIPSDVAKAERRALHQREPKPWIRHVKSYITLGSPIDKILGLWWLNYEYLDNPMRWLNREMTANLPLSRIEHYNYCDEQDPVGHYLDDIEKKKGYQLLFDKKEDIVYNRSAMPGVAHVEYWKDTGLFQWIAARTIFRKPTPPARSFWFKRKTYTAILAVTYIILPLVIAGADFIAMTWALKAATWQATVLSAFGFVLLTWLGRNLVILLVAWRMSSKRADANRVNGQSISPDRFYKYLLWAIFAIMIGGSATMVMFYPCGVAFLSFKKFIVFLTTVTGCGVLVWLFARLTSKRKPKLLKVQTGNFGADIVVFVAALLVIWVSYMNGRLVFDPTDAQLAQSTAAKSLGLHFHQMAFFTLSFIVNFFSFLLYIKGKRSIKEILPSMQSPRR